MSNDKSRHKIYSEQCSLNFNSNPANPFSLQISSQLVTRGAGGRGEALGYFQDSRKKNRSDFQYFQDSRN